MRKFILGIAAVAALVVPSVASADVARYQEQSATFTAVQPAGQVGQFANVWTHTYNVTVNPCDGTFVGEGVQDGQDQQGVQHFTETVTGSFGDGTVTFSAHRSDNVDFALADAPTDGNAITLATSSPVVPWVLEFKVSPPKFTNTTTYKNHGQYVSAQGGGADAAHSCIGMPINSAR
jgi:hypothetical protein